MYYSSSPSHDLLLCLSLFSIFFVKQKTAYEMRISDWSSDVCSSDLVAIETEDGRTASQEILYPSNPGSIYHMTKCLDQQLFAFYAGMTAFASPTCIREIGRASCRERVCQSCRSRW